MEIIKSYLDINSMSRPATPIGPIKAVVIHWVGNPKSTALANRNYFNRLKEQDKIYASSHYIIGLEGEILACVPENEVAYHSKQANSYSIGIENCHEDWNGEFNYKTYQSLIALCVDLCKRYNLSPLTDLKRHYDITGKDCPKYYVQNTKAWEQLKKDVASHMIEEDKALADAVSQIILSGVLINFNQWKRIDLIKLKNVPSLIKKLGGINDLVDKKIITDVKLWQSQGYSASHVRSLLIKYAKTLK